MVQKELHELFAKKESRLISDIELLKLEYLLKSEVNREEYNRLVALTRSISLTMKFDIRKNRERVINEIRKYEPDFTMGNSNEPKKIHLHIWSYWTAVVLLITVGISSILYYYHGDDGFLSKVTHQYYSARLGQNLTVKLNDGSTILLNGGSTIHFSSKFSKVKRKIWLEGEAFCQISKDSEHPFVINVENYKVEVLGTTFNIAAYKEDKLLELALIEGTVKFIQNPKNEIFIAPGKMLSLNKQTDKYTQDTFSYDDVIGWKDNIVVFRNTALTEVLKNFERRYGVIFVIEDVNISNFYINATFRNESFDTILKTIEFATDIAFEPNNKSEITLINKQSN
ncbi:MAG: FecR family protein [Mangrovibacterium sp.]